MKKVTTIGLAAVFCLVSTVAIAEDGYISFDADENMVVSGPFDVIIPKPGDARIGGPENSTDRLMDENLRLSKAGYFADDQFVLVQVETTDGAAGTLTNKHLPVRMLAGREYRARSLCLDISQEELDADDDVFFEFIESQNVQMVPAVQAIQLMATTEDGTGQGTILFMRNVAGGCAAMSEEFEARFDSDFERFVESINTAN